MKITYLNHSGFAAEFDDMILIFDYYKGELPDIAEEKKLYVFASHAHYDHFNPAIFEWEMKHPLITYILSDDIKGKGPKEKIIFIGARQEIKVDGLTVKTLRSTDEGVAFFVRVNGKVLYHAGDLNWWHWEEESAVYNELMKQNYQREIGRIDGEKIDAAFVPADPRLESAYYWGMDYFMRHTDTKYVFPMHLWGQYDVYERLMKEKDTEVYRNCIMHVTTDGQTFEI